MKTVSRLGSVMAMSRSPSFTLAWIISGNSPSALPAKTRSARPWWTQLWVWVLIGMAAGIALGVADPDLAGQMGPLGDAFIRMIQMVIGPIIFCTVVHGIAEVRDLTPARAASGDW